MAAERSGSGRLRAAQGGRERTITIDTVLFDGLLEVTEATALRHAWSAGIGPGQGMGTGHALAGAGTPV